jgi:hypothetical protein
MLSFLLRVIYAACHLCQVSSMQSVANKSFQLNVVILKVVIVNVVMLSVVAPYYYFG